MIPLIPCVMYAVADYKFGDEADIAPSRVGRREVAMEKITQAMACVY